MPTATLATDLERRRLAHRATRIERVIAALRQRALYRDAIEGRAPRPLRQALADFEAELGAIRRRLAELEG